MWSQSRQVDTVSAQPSANGWYVCYNLSDTTTSLSIDYQIDCGGYVLVYARRYEPSRAKVISGGVPSLSAAEQSEFGVSGISASGLPVGISTVRATSGASRTATDSEGTADATGNASNLTQLDFTSDTFDEREAIDFFEVYLKDIRGPYYEEAFTHYLGDSYYKKMSGSDPTPVGVHQYWAGFDSVTIMGTTESGTGTYRVLIYAASDGDKHKVFVQWQVACRDSSQSLDSCPASDLYITDGRVI